MWIRVCSVDAVPPGQLRVFEVGSPPRRLVIANVSGVLHCAPDRCPHGAMPLARGYLSGQRIVCGSHFYEFDLETGAATGDHTWRLTGFAVELNGQDVLVELP